MRNAKFAACAIILAAPPRIVFSFKSFKSFMLYSTSFRA
jgi:hypothetical protein